MYGRRNKLEICTKMMCLTEKRTCTSRAGCSAVLNQMEPSPRVPRGIPASGMGPGPRQGAGSPRPHAGLWVGLHGTISVSAGCWGHCSESHQIKLNFEYLTYEKVPLGTDVVCNNTDTKSSLIIG